MGHLYVDLMDYINSAFESSNTLPTYQEVWDMAYEHGKESIVKTGRAVIRLNEDTGKVYWNTWIDMDKDGVNMDDGKPLQMLPEAFSIGTVVEIYETLK